MASQQVAFLYLELCSKLLILGVQLQMKRSPLLLLQCACRSQPRREGLGGMMELHAVDGPLLGDLAAPLPLPRLLNLLLLQSARVLGSQRTELLFERRLPLLGGLRVRLNSLLVLRVQRLVLRM